MGIGTSDGKYFENDFDHAFHYFSEGQQNNFETRLTPIEESHFQVWKQDNAPKDSGFDYDFRGAFKAGISIDPETQHWPDTFKKPNHPTFSDQSQYAKDAPELAGSWDGDTYIPAGSVKPQQRINETFGDVKTAVQEGVMDPQGANYSSAFDPSTVFASSAPNKQTFLPDYDENALIGLKAKGNNWPRGVTGVFPEITLDDEGNFTRTGTKVYSKSLSQEIIDQGVEASKKDAGTVVDKVAATVKINPKAWEDWLASQEPSEMIEDRRQGETNGQVLMRKLKDWWTGHIGGGGRFGTEPDTGATRKYNIEEPGKYRGPEIPMDQFPETKEDPFLYDQNWNSEHANDPPPLANPPLMREQFIGRWPKPFKPYPYKHIDKQSMSDEQPGPLRPGQQYAMEARRNPIEGPPKYAEGGVGKTEKFEWPVKTLSGKTVDTPIVTNPSARDVTSMLNKSPYGEVRALRAPDGKIYMWPANDALHHDIARNFDLNFKTSKDIQRNAYSFTKKDVDAAGKFKSFDELLKKLGDF